jgi:predicted metal-dependent phosphotriesterase family hydrolase
MGFSGSRRNFLKQSIVMGAGLITDPLYAWQSNPVAEVLTVNGPVSKTGFTLVHEHIMVDFIGADKVSPSRYDAEEVFRTALPKLRSLKAKGCDTLVECTPAYLGRDAALLKRLSAASGLRIVTNTGYYGAAKEKYLPALAYKKSAAEIADTWIREFRSGIDKTGIRPGFIKCAVDTFPLSEVQRKMIEAAAITHLATGLTIYVHSGNGAAAHEEMRILQSKNLSPSAWVWVHAQNEKNRTIHYEIAKAGGWISYDGVSASSIDDCIGFLTDMKKEQLLDKVLLSQDSGWYHVGEAGGGKYNDYNTIIDQLIPAMKQKGFSGQDITLLFHTNPFRALSISIKKI